VRIEPPFHNLAASKASPWGNFLPRVCVIARADVPTAREWRPQLADKHRQMAAMARNTLRPKLAGYRLITLASQNDPDQSNASLKRGQSHVAATGRRKIHQRGGALPAGQHSR